MRILKIKLATILRIAFLLAFVQPFSVAIQAQTVDDPEDLRKIRILLAQKASLEAEVKELNRQKDAWQRQAREWRKLYEAEKDRADVVIGAQVDALKQSNAQLRLAQETLRQQIARDKEYIDRLERRVSSLKRQRLIFGVVGFAAGTAVGSRINF